MAKNTDRQDIENFTDSFRGYVAGIAPQNQAKGIGCTAKGNLCRQ